MLVYSVASRQSFDMIRIIREKILNHLVSLAAVLSHWFCNLLFLSSSPRDRSFDCFEQSTDWVPIVVVGNKSDLRPEQRQVSVEEGRKIAEEFNCGWTEASARFNVNVAKAFEIMIGEIEKSQNPTQPAGEGKCCVM